MSFATGCIRSRRVWGGDVTESESRLREHPGQGGGRVKKSQLYDSLLLLPLVLLGGSGVTFIDTGLGLLFSWNGMEGPLTSCFLASSSSKAPAVCDLSTCVQPVVTGKRRGDAPRHGGHHYGNDYFSMSRLEAKQSELSWPL